jgi:hypothetical protein
MSPDQQVEPHAEKVLSVVRQVHHERHVRCNIKHPPFVQILSKDLPKMFQHPIRVFDLSVSSGRGSPP